MSGNISPESQVYINFLILSGLGQMQDNWDLRNPEVSRMNLLANELRIHYLDSPLSQRLELLQLMSDSLSNVEQAMATVREHVEKETQKINSEQALNSEKTPA